MSSGKNDIESRRLIDKLNSRYKNIDVHDVVNNEDGSVSLILNSSADNVAAVLSNMNMGSPATLPAIDKEDVGRLRSERASIMSRDPLSRGYLDLGKRPFLDQATPQEIYSRSISYYRTKNTYGSYIDTLSNFASSGMVNDIDDDDIRSFYDHWVIDSGLDVLVEQIFLEMFRTGFVRTYRVMAKYVPKVSYLPPVPGQKVSSAQRLRWENAAKKNKWSKSHIPISYTILNPTQIKVEKSSLLLNKQIIVLQSSAFKDIKELLEIPAKELTVAQKMIIKNLPTDFKKAALEGKDLVLDPSLVGEVDYRRQPYERYPFPKGMRAFESYDYKDALKKADSSTLDGISNYLLVVTIGNDMYPVKKQDRLEAVAEMFNTPSKAFNVVWDHTLNVKRVEPSNVGDILGHTKYLQVNEDISGSFAVIRSLLDGRGDSSKEHVKIAVQAVREEIQYVRKQVVRWIYREYRDVAEAMGFQQFPKVRFNNMILKDEILMMNVIQGMIDRRIISYRSGHEMLGLDYDTILHELHSERDYVLDGTLGIIGSPYNPKATPFAPQDNIQDTQRAPKGSPSEGRPKGKPAKTPAPSSKPQKQKPKKPEAAKVVDIHTLLNTLSIDEIKSLSELLNNAVNTYKDKD